MSKNIRTLDKLFSHKGTFNRIDYLIYGIVIPILLSMISLSTIFLLLPGFINEVKIENVIIGVIMLILGILSTYIIIVAVIKRARDHKSNIVLMVIYIFLPYLNILTMLYLLFSPTKINIGKSK